MVNEKQRAALKGTKRNQFRLAYNSLMFPEILGKVYPDAETTMDSAKLDINPEEIKSKL